MASGFPYNSSGSRIIDAFSNPTAANNLSSPNHAVLHSDVNDAITRLETVAQNRGGRNLLYNGAMQVSQRSTSIASITANGYYTADRWQTTLSSLGTWTQSVSTDAPTGSGFRNSLRMLCTTADAAPASTDVLQITQSLEGLDLQGIRKGTSSAEQLSLSFWVKSTNTGTFIVSLTDVNNTRQISKAYTISASNTWEFETVTFPADTSGVLPNSSSSALRLNFWLGAGSSFTSGSLNSTAWATTTDANTAVGQVNLAGTLNNDWFVTGVQLSVGGTTSPFQFKSYNEELRECQRYYYRMTSPNTNYMRFGTGLCTSTTSCAITTFFPVTMRTSPLALEQSGTANHFVVANSTGGAVICSAVPTFNTAGIYTADTTFTVASGLTAGNATYAVANATTSAYLGWSAEL